MDPFCYLCFTFVFIILYCLFNAALWPSAGIGLTSDSLVCDVFLMFLSLSHMLS